MGQQRQIEVVSAGIIVADHLCEPIDHVPEPGELVAADRLVLEVGGCAANVAVDLAKMGVTASVCGCIGEDPFGDFLIQMLNERGVATTGIRRTDKADTSQTLIINVRGQDRRFIHCFGANAHFRAEHISRQLVANAKVLYLGGYLVMPSMEPAALAELFAEARRQEVRTVLDVVVPEHLAVNAAAIMEQLRPVLAETDVFLPNEDEARLITGRSDPFEQAEVFRDAGAATVVITRGDAGAMLVADGVRLRAGAFQIEYVDGSGGGDAFDAGYICGLLRNYDYRGCLELASALGASCVRAVGTTPGVFTRQECEQFLKQHKLEIEEL